MVRFHRSPLDSVIQAEILVPVTRLLLSTDEIDSNYYIGLLDIFVVLCDRYPKNEFASVGVLINTISGISQKISGRKRIDFMQNE